MKPTIFLAKSLVLNLGLLLSCHAFAASQQYATTTQLNAEIASRQSADTTESNARQTGDAELQTKTDNEAGARQTADTTLQTNIDNETSARVKAVNDIKDQITNSPKPGYPYTLIVGKDIDDGTTGRSLGTPEYPTITDALNSIPTGLYNSGACTARYLVKILPGTYAERVAMRPCVDIEGSGELTTTITAVGAVNCDSSAATVSGANAAELRFLTVANTAGSNCAIAIYNNGVSPRLTHVTATASGASTDYYVGVYNVSSSPMMTYVTADASGFAFSLNTGIYNDSSSPTMTNVTTTASRSGFLNSGVYNKNSSSPIMTNVTATASAPYDPVYSFGVANSDSSSSPIMTNVTASGGIIGSSYGVGNCNSCSPTIHHSTISGKSYSIQGGNSKVGASQLVGPASNATCAASYDGNFTPLSTACQ